MTATFEAYSDTLVDVRAGRVHLLRGGRGDSVLVLHHDIGSVGWQRFHELLADKFSVHLPDLPGFGRSDRPEMARHTRDLAIHLSLFLDRLGLNEVSVVGLGYGGWVAAEMAAMNQRRCQKLVLVNPAGLQPREGFILDQFLLGAADYVKAGFADASAFQAQFGVELETIHVLASTPLFATRR
jgi:pimeloyl-ACP methyl ester carboxylesterase